jgi:hypothetical protein
MTFDENTKFSPFFLSPTLGNIQKGPLFEVIFLETKKMISKRNFEIFSQNIYPFPSFVKIFELNTLF